jgi:hypothetical protein
LPSLRLTKLVSLLVLLSCLPAISLVQAADVISPFTAEYHVIRNDSKIGERTHVLRQQENGYLFEARMHTTGLAALLKPGEVTERSHWLLSNNRIQPQRYEYLDSSDESRTTKLQFDWQRRHVTNSIGDKPWGMNIPAGTQDKFGYMLALMHDLQQGNTEPEYQIADGGKLKTYRFISKGKVLLDTALGKLEAIKLQRFRVGKKKRKVFIWCAPSLGYLPVRIERHKKNTVYTMLIQKIEGR